MLFSRGCYQSFAAGGDFLELLLCGGIRCFWRLVQERASAASASSARILITRLTGTLRDFLGGVVRGNISAFLGTVALGVVLAGFGIIVVGGGAGGWGRSWYKSCQMVGVVAVTAFWLGSACTVDVVEAWWRSWSSLVRRGAFVFVFAIGDCATSLHKIAAVSMYLCGCAVWLVLFSCVMGYDVMFQLMPVFFCQVSVM